MVIQKKRSNPGTYKETLRGVHLQSSLGIHIFETPQIIDATEYVKPSYEFTMLKISMPRSAFIFKFRQILQRIFFLVELMATKKVMYEVTKKCFRSKNA